MEKRLFVGNLPFSLTPEGLEQEFSKYGLVTFCSIAKYFEGERNGQSRGFGFVEFSSVAEATKALALDNTEVFNRTIVVREARPKPDKFA